MATRPRRIMVLFRAPVSGPRGRPYYVWRKSPVDIEVGQPPILVAIVGVNQYGVQFGITNAPIEWSISDPTVAAYQGRPDGSILVTPIKTGAVTITARLGTLADTASLVVTQGVPLSIRIVFPAA
jgi:hypothetical protein